MNSDFDKLLDECIDLLVQGGTVQQCLDLNPDSAVELEPLLSIFTQYSGQNVFIPSSAAKARGRARLEQRIASPDTNFTTAAMSLIRKFFARPLLWAPVAAVIVALLISAALGAFSSGSNGSGGSVIASPTPPPTQAPIIARMGTVEIRITDDPAYDISEVNMIISHLQVLRTGSETAGEGNSSWQTVIEGSRSFELLELRDKEKVIGTSEIQAGYYSQIRNNLDEVTVTFDGESRRALLPSGMSAIYGSFVVKEGETTILLLDIDAAESVHITSDGYVVFDPVTTLYVSYEGENSYSEPVGKTPEKSKWMPVEDESGKRKPADNDTDNDGVIDELDIDPVDPNVCQDADGDGCDDCSIGTDHCGPLPDNDPSNDGTDTDGDGLCDAGDDDDDNDGVNDAADADPLNPDVCEDADGDGCDDCSVGTDDFGPLADNDPANDGIDTDGDGVCDAGDDDDDNDGVKDDADADPLNPDVCEDADGDGCDDCSIGTDDFGPLADNDPANDGPDSDGDGICDITDTDDDDYGGWDGGGDGGDEDEDDDGDDDDGDDDNGDEDDEDGDEDEDDDGDDDDDGDRDKGHGNDDDGEDDDNPGGKKSSDDE